MVLSCVTGLRNLLAAWLGLADRPAAHGRADPPATLQTLVSLAPPQRLIHLSQIECSASVISVGRLSSAALRRTAKALASTERANLMKV
jgi:hypothetical protein